jgi:hypothetical protein
MFADTQQIKCESPFVLVELSDQQKIEYVKARNGLYKKFLPNDVPKDLPEDLVGKWGLNMMIEKATVSTASKDPKSGEKGTIGDLLDTVAYYELAKNDQNLMKKLINTIPDRIKLIKKNKDIFDIK